MSTTIQDLLSTMAERDALQRERRALRRELRLMRGYLRALASRRIIALGDFAEAAARIDKVLKSKRRTE